MNTKYSISTAWNIERGQGREAEDIISEILKAGFHKLELNFTISSELLKQLIDIIKIKNLQVTSMHNYCPVPAEMDGNVSPDYFSISAIDEEERKKAVEYTKKTIDTASRVGAKVVVLHSGRVEMECKYKKLIRLFNANRKHDNEYKQIVFEMLEERKSKSPPYINSAVRSIEELTKYAANKNIIIGLETRYYYREIPQFEEFEYIFDKVNKPNLCYWHDIGHAQCSEVLGIVSHLAYFEKYSYRMIGVHYHDIDGTNDHILPGDGSFDFSILKGYIKRDLLQVFEPHPPVDINKLQESLSYINNIFK